MSAEEVAMSFINHYYTTLNTNPANLAGLYQAQSTLTFERNNFQGAQAIVEKLQSLGQVQHNVPVLTKDFQISVSSNALLVFVTGQLRLSGEQPMTFAEVFQLVASAPGNYYIHNQMFRLVLGI